MRRLIPVLLLAPAMALAQEYSGDGWAGPRQIVQLDAQPAALRGAFPTNVFGPFETEAGTRLVEIYTDIPLEPSDGDESLDARPIVAARVIGISGSTWWSVELSVNGFMCNFGEIERHGIATVHIPFSSTNGGRYAENDELFWNFSGCEPTAYSLSTSEPYALGTCGVFSETYRTREQVNCSWDTALDTLVCRSETQIEAPGRSLIRLERLRYRADTRAPLAMAPAFPSLEAAALSRPEEPLAVSSGEIVVHAASVPSRVRGTGHEVLYDLQTARFLVVTVRDGHAVPTWEEPRLELGRPAFVPSGPVHASIRFLPSRPLWKRDGLSIHQIALVDGEVHEVAWVGIEERSGKARIDFLRVASSRATPGHCGDLEFPNTALAISNEVRSSRVFAKRLLVQGSFEVSREVPDEATAAVAISHVTWNDGFQVDLEPGTEEQTARIARVDEASGALSARIWAEGELSNW